MSLNAPVSGIKPLINFAMVDLPLPDFHKMATSPCLISKETALVLDVLLPA